MTIRALIAWPGHGFDLDTFTGIYVHDHGQPTHTGRAVWKQTVIWFKSDADLAARYYIDHHPTGWARVDGEALTDNECYCHDRRAGLQEGFTYTQNDTQNIDYVYVLTAAGLYIRPGNSRSGVTVPWDQDRVHWDDIQHEVDSLPRT